MQVARQLGFTELLRYHVQYEKVSNGSLAHCGAG